MNTTRIPVGHRGMYIHIPFAVKSVPTVISLPYQGLEYYFDVYAYALRQEIESSQSPVGDRALRYDLLRRWNTDCVAH